MEEIILAEEWKKVEVNAFKFENEGDSIEGVYLRAEKSTQYENDNYVLETTDGNKTVFGTAVLNTKMANIPLGKMVKIVYIGKAKSKKGVMYKDFDVFVK